MDLGDLFDENELELDRNVVIDDIEKVRGIVPLPRVAEALLIPEAQLRSFASLEARKAVDIYAKYGIRKDAGRWKVFVPRFLDSLELIRGTLGKRKEKLVVQKVPLDITREEFFQLQGTFKLNDLYRVNNGRGFLPLPRLEVLVLIKREDLTKETCGIFQHGKLHYLDFEVFLAWVLSTWRKIPLEEAQDLVNKLKK